MDIFSRIPEHKALREDIMTSLRLWSLVGLDGVCGFEHRHELTRSRVSNDAGNWKRNTSLLTNILSSNFYGIHAILKKLFSLNVIFLSPESLNTIP